jgi:cytochrome c556
MSPYISDDKKLVVIKIGIVLLMGAVISLAASCSWSSDDKDKSSFEQSPKGQADSKQVAQDKIDYAYAQKAEFSKDMKDKVATLNQDIDGLSAKIEKGSDAVKADAKPKLQDLRDQVTSLNAQLAKIPEATESTWDSVKSGFNKGYVATVDGIQSARKWVSDKIAL